MSCSNGPAFMFLFGHWWQQLRERGLGANCKLRGNSEPRRGTWAKPTPCSGPERQILMAPHAGTCTLHAFSQLILEKKKKSESRVLLYTHFTDKKTKAREVMKLFWVHAAGNRPIGEGRALLSSDSSGRFLISIAARSHPRALSSLPKVTEEGAGAAIRTPAPLVSKSCLFPCLATVFPRLCLLACCLTPGNWLCVHNRKYAS